MQSFVCPNCNMFLCHNSAVKEKGNRTLNAEQPSIDYILLYHLAIMGILFTLVA